MDVGTIALLRQRRNHKRSEFARKYRWIIPVCLWLLAFILLWRFNLSGAFVMESDTVREYEVYAEVIKNGTVDVESHGLLNSALMTTALPAFLQRMTGIPPLPLFQYYPLLIFPFLPVVLWFIFRRYVGDLHGALASVAIIAQPHFLWSPSMARVTMALLFVAIAVLLILSKAKLRYPLLALSGLLVVLSHYSTTFALILSLAGIAGIWAIVSSIKRHWDFTYIKPVLFLLGMVAVYSLVWHGMIFQRPLGYGMMVLSDVVNPPGTYYKVEVTPQYDTQAPSPTDDKASFFSLESRDPVLQVAFGATWQYMNLPQRIEFVISWLVILALTYGVVRVVRRRDYRIEAKATALVAYGLCLAGIIYPAISVNYGIARVYYFASLALAPCLIVGLTTIASKVRVSSAVLCAVLVFGYMLATTGILHSFMGLQR